MIHKNQRKRDSNAPAAEDATRVEEGESCRSELHGDAGNEDDGTDHNGPSSTNEICEGTGK